MKKIIFIFLFVCVMSFVVKSQCTPYAGADQSICGNVVHLSATINSCSGYWTGSLGTIFTPSDTAHNCTAIFLNMNSQLTITWTETDGINTFTDNVLITVQAATFQAFAGMDASVCSNTSSQVFGSVTGGVGNGVWSSFDQVTITQNPLDPHATVTVIPNNALYGSDSKYEAVLTWTVTIGTCTTADNLIMTFYQTPVANAGLTSNKYNIATCDLTTELHAIPSISASNGTWSETSGLCPFLYFSSANNPQTTFGEIGCYGIFKLYWTEKHNVMASCNSKDSILVEFIKRPNISAGVDTSLCGDKLHLHAVSDTSADYSKWSTLLPVNWLSADTFPNAYVQRPTDTNVTVAFTWTAYKQSSVENLQNIVQCPSKDSVLVHFYVDYPAIVFTNNDTMITCGNIFDGLHTDSIPQGIGFWIDDSYSTIFSPTQYPENLNSTATVNTAGMHTFYWIVKNGTRPNGAVICSDTSDALHVKFIEYPSAANSGGKLWLSNPNHSSKIKWDTVCGDKYALHPNLNGMGIPQWISPNSNVKFTSTNSTTTALILDTVKTNIFNSDVITPTYYEVYLSLDNSVIPYPPYTYGCKHKDTLRLTFARVPTGLIDIRKPYCNGETAPISAKEDPEGKPKYFEWNFHGGVLDSVNAMYPNDSVYYVRWDTLGGDNFHLATLISKNLWGCKSKQITDTIYEPEPIYPIDSSYNTTCHLANGRIKLIPISGCNSCVYIWTDPIFSSNPTLSERNNLASGVKYNLMLNYISWNPIHTCKFLFSRTLRDTGEVIAQFFIPNDTIHLGSSIEVFFINHSIGGKTFEWHFGDGGTSTAENPSHTFTHKGVFEVYLIAKSKEGCEDKSEIVKIEIETSVPEFSNSVPSISMYPNPVKDEIKIVVTGLSGLNQFKILEISNMFGKLIYTTNVINQTTINVSDLPKGIYLIKIYTEKQINFKKFVKE